MKKIRRHRRRMRLEEEGRKVFDQWTKRHTSHCSLRRHHPTIDIVPELYSHQYHQILFQCLAHRYQYKQSLELKI